MKRQSPEEQSPEEQSQEERISAYLDGELSPDEAQSVERLLADRDDLRQLHDELLAVRASLKALYRHRLEEGFSEHVLRRAERAVLSRPAPEVRPSVAGEFSENGSASPVRLPRPFSSTRSWLWAAAAVAAAIVLFVNQPRDDGPQDQAGEEGRLAASSEKTGLDRDKLAESNLTAIESPNRREEVTSKKAAKPQQPLAFQAPKLAKKSDEAKSGSAGGGQASGQFDDRDGKTPRGGEAQEIAQYEYRITRQVAQSGVIERLLAENRIAMETKDRFASRIGDLSKAADDLKQLSPSDGAASDAPKRFEVIYVEGPPRQVEALLSALPLQSGVSRLNVPDEKSDRQTVRSGAKGLSLDAAPIAKAAAKPPPEGKAKGRATKRAAKLNRALSQADEPLPTEAATKKTKAATTPVAGRAWRDTGEARSLTERYYKSIAAEAAPRRKADGDPKGVKDKEEFAAFKRPANIAPALVTVKLILRVVGAPSEKPPAAAAKPGN